MDLYIGTFLSNILSNPFFLVCSLLTIGVNALNEKTLAPNTIATTISTRTVSPKAGVLIVVFGNFIGLVLMTLVNATVARTMFNIANFGQNLGAAIIGLCGGMVAFTVWQILSSRLGLPSSGSHALIASLSGAAVATLGSFDALNLKEWTKVLIGLVTSPVLGFSLGWLMAKLIQLVFRKVERYKANSLFGKAQILATFANAFMNGAHDGQKFLGVFLIGISLAMGNGNTITEIPIWLTILCAVAMAAGASMCSIKVVKSAGRDMVKI